MRVAAAVTWAASAVTVTYVAIEEAVRGQVCQ